MPAAAAAMSLMTLIFSFSAVSMKSHRASMALLNSSATSTSAVAAVIMRKSSHWRSQKLAARTSRERTSL